MVVLLIVASILVSGIIRHDVSKEKYLELAQQQQFNCVGQILNKKGLVGSCVLINNKYVITAAHLFREFDLEPDTQKKLDERIGDIADYQIKLMNNLYKGVKLILHPAYMDTANKNNTDLALIELEIEVTDVEPAILNTTYDELNSISVTVGYGVLIIANQPQYTDTTRIKMAGENVIDSLGGYKVPETNEYAILYADLDHPDNKECCNKIGSPEPLPLEYVITGGDSGGGLFTNNGNRWKLIGVTTGSIITINPKQMKNFEYYGQIISYWTRVSVFTDWINQNIEK